MLAGHLKQIKRIQEQVKDAEADKIIKNELEKERDAGKGPWEFIQKGVNRGKLDLDKTKVGGVSVGNLFKEIVAGGLPGSGTKVRTDEHGVRRRDLSISGAKSLAKKQLQSQGGGLKRATDWIAPSLMNVEGKKGESNRKQIQNILFHKKWTLEAGRADFLANPG